VGKPFQRVPVGPIGAAQSRMTRPRAKPTLLGVGAKWTLRRRALSSRSPVRANRTNRLTQDPSGSVGHAARRLQPRLRDPSPHVGSSGSAGCACIHRSSQAGTGCWDKTTGASGGCM